MRIAAAAARVRQVVKGRVAGVLFVVLACSLFAAVWLEAARKSAGERREASGWDVRPWALCSDEQAAEEYAEFYWDDLRSVDQSLFERALDECSECPESRTCGPIRTVAAWYAIGTE